MPREALLGLGAKVLKVVFFSYRAQTLHFTRWCQKRSDVYFCSIFECFLDSPGGLEGGLKVTQNRVNNDYVCSTFHCFCLVLIIGRGRDLGADNTIIEVLSIEFAPASKKTRFIYLERFVSVFFRTARIRFEAFCCAVCHRGPSPEKSQCAKSLYNNS